MYSWRFLSTAMTRRPNARLRVIQAFASWDLPNPRSPKITPFGDEKPDSSRYATNGSCTTAAPVATSTPSRIPWLPVGGAASARARPAICLLVDAVMCSVDCESFIPS